MLKSGIGHFIQVIHLKKWTVGQEFGLGEEYKFFSFWGGEGWFARIGFSRFNYTAGILDGMGSYYACRLWVGVLFEQREHTYIVQLQREVGSIFFHKNNYLEVTILTILSGKMARPANTTRNARHLRTRRATPSWGCAKRHATFIQSCHLSGSTSPQLSRPRRLKGELTRIC